MNKFMISIFIILLLGLGLVSATDTDLVINSVTPTPTSGRPGDTINIAVSVTNSGASNIALVNVKSSDLTFGPNIIHAPAVATIINLGASGSGTETKTATLTLTVPSILNGGYLGEISVTDASDGTNPVSAHGNYAITVTAENDYNILTFTDTNPLVITGQEDSVITGTFSIQNTGSTSLTFNAASYDISQIDLSDGKRDITLSFSEVTIAPGETKAVTVTATVPNNMDVDTYNGILKVTSASVEKTFKLEIKIHPELCKDGVVGDLRLTVDEPDSGDEFAPGETMSITVNVENEGDKDVNDVVVTAFLYNVDQDDKIEEVDSEPDDVDEGDDRDFEFDLEIPLEDIDEKDEYVLFVKAYEDGNEDDHCAEGEVSVDIEREKHDVIIRNINVLPLSVKQGERFDVSARAVNVGSENEDDVTVRLRISELGISETSEPFDLDDGESKDNEQVVTFRNLQVPETAKVKTYSVEVTVVFDDGDEERTDFGDLIVIEGEVTPTPVTADVLKIQSTSEVSTGTFSVSAVVTNPSDSAKTYTVDATASWAQTVGPQVAILSAGESKVLQFTFVALEGTEDGSYSGTLMVREDATLVDSEVFNVVVRGVAAKPSGITGFTVFEGISGKTVLFIIGDIVLIIIAIFFIRLIFTSGKKKGSVPKIEKVKL